MMVAQAMFVDAACVMLGWEVEVAKRFWSGCVEQHTAVMLVFLLLHEALSTRTLCCDACTAPSTGAWHLLTIG